MEDTRLRLVLEQQYGKTLLSDCYFTAPLKVGTPRVEDDRLKVVFMMASAGVLKGDHFSYDILCRKHTKAELTEQSYTKIFDSNGGTASKRLSIRVEENAEIYYHPCAVIPFKNSWFDAENEIHLDKNAVFAYSDILANGRIAMGEQYAFRHYRNKTKVYVDEIPVFLEHSFFEPEHQRLDSMFYFDGYTHQGSFYYYSPDAGMLEKLYQNPFDSSNLKASDQAYVNEVLKEDIIYGVSRAKAGVIFKILAKQAQDIEDIFQVLYQLLFMTT